MLPEKNDPRWKDLVMGEKTFAFEELATKMVVMRSQMLVRTLPSEAKIQEAIDLVHAFFSKNEYAVKEDIKAIFG